MCNLVNINTNYNTQVRVAEIKIKEIQNIIAAASKCVHIQEIILFGSALQTCTQIGRPAADTINISPCYNTFMSTYHNAYLRILHFLMAQHRCLIF